jgi:hypothetical protein
MSKNGGRPDTRGVMIATSRYPRRRRPASRFVELVFCLALTFAVTLGITTLASVGANARIRCATSSIVSLSARCQER